MEVTRARLTIGSDTVPLLAASPDALRLAEPLSTSTEGDIPVILTRSLAARLDAQEGTAFTARIRSVVRPLTFEVAQIVDALPGVGDELGIATDPQSLREAGADLVPNELWIRTDDPDTAASWVRGAATVPVRILTAAQVSAAPVTSSAPALLAVGALIATGLGGIGFFAGISASGRVRRGEAAVLRALGVRGSTRRAMRLGETAGIAVYAVALGAAVGAAVAAPVLAMLLGADA